MQPIHRNIPVLLVLATVLAGCGGGGERDAGTDFTRFVKDQLAATSDTTEPATVNDRNFRFNDRDNPDAYDDVL